MDSKSFSALSTRRRKKEDVKDEDAEDDTPLKHTESHHYPPLKSKTSRRNAIKWDEAPVWPYCMKNVQYLSEHLFHLNLTSYVVSGKNVTGCWENDCSRTDRFDVDKTADCAEVCGKIEDCKFWYYKYEDGKHRCILKPAGSIHQGSSSSKGGPRTCKPESVEDQANKKNESVEDQANKKDESVEGQADEKDKADEKDGKAGATEGDNGDIDFDSRAQDYDHYMYID